jgi:hypothetical protein
MTALLGSVLLASLAGSPHCGGMCGGVAAFCAGAGTCGTGQSGLCTALYHAARLLAYILVGAVAGLAGTAVDAGGTLVGVQRAAAVMAGAMVALMGVGLLMHAGAGRGGVRLPAWMDRMVRRVRTRAIRLPAPQRSLLIGAITPLLPCGWLWAFAAVAAGTGSLPWGAAVMAFFWVGTVPVLAAVGAGVAVMGLLRRPWVSALAGTLMIAVGVHTAFVRGPLAGAVMAGTVESGRIPELDERPACCRAAEMGP